MVFHDGSGKIPLVRVFGLSGASTVSGLRGFRVKGLRASEYQAGV